MRYADHSPSSSVVSLTDGVADAPGPRAPRSCLATLALALLFVSLAILADSVGAPDEDAVPAATIASAAR